MYMTMSEVTVTEMMRLSIMSTRSDTIRNRALAVSYSNLEASAKLRKEK